MQRQVQLARTTLLLSLALMPIDGVAQVGTSNGEWRSYAGDVKGTRYAPLDQITADNFNDLEVAWRLKTANLGPEPEYNFQSTPLMVNGVVFTTAGTRRAVVAADAGTGELLWMHRLDEGERGEAAPRRLSGRGLAYWDDGALRPHPLRHARLPPHRPGRGHRDAGRGLRD